MIHPTVKLGLPLLLALAGVHDDGNGISARTASGKDPVQLQLEELGQRVRIDERHAVRWSRPLPRQFFQITSDTTVG